MTGTQKRLGQFFTPPEVARTLVSWVVSNPRQRLLDPSCGDGEFLVCHRRSVGIDVDRAHSLRARSRAPGALVHVLTEGLVFQRLLTPELMPDEVFRAAFAALGKKAKD